MCIVIDLYPAKEVQWFTRNLFRCIFYIFAICIERVQDSYNYSLCSLSPLCSIHCHRCHWFTRGHNWSKLKFFFFISYADTYHYTTTGGSTSIWNWLTVNVISHFDCPNDSSWLLWLHRPMYIGMHKPLKPIICFIHLAWKSSKIYRCWIVWGKNIWVVIVPSFLAITYMGQSIYLHLISRFQFIASSYLASVTRGNINWKWRCFRCPLGGHTGSNRFSCIHGCECSGDGLDHIQDLQGVLGS